MTRVRREMKLTLQNKPGIRPASHNLTIKSPRHSTAIKQAGTIKQVTELDSVTMKQNTWHLSLDTEPDIVKSTDIIQNLLLSHSFAVQCLREIYYGVEHAFIKASHMVSPWRIRAGGEAERASSNTPM